jgi:hypothetical protein
MIGFSKKEHVYIEKEYRTFRELSFNRTSFMFFIDGPLPSKRRLCLLEKGREERSI